MGAARTLDAPAGEAGPALVSDAPPVLPLRAVPVFATTPAHVRDLALDARAAYVLSLVDGECSVETILDVCDMERDEAVGILRDLLALEAIRL